MEVKVQEVGNSTMLTIPKEIVRKAKLKKGDTVNISILNDQIQISPKPKKKTLLDFVGIVKLEKGSKLDMDELTKELKDGRYKDN